VAAQGGHGLVSRHLVTGNATHEVAHDRIGDLVASKGQGGVRKRDTGISLGGLSASN